MSRRRNPGLGLEGASISEGCALARRRIPLSHRELKHHPRDSAGRPASSWPTDARCLGLRCKPPRRSSRSPLSHRIPASCPRPQAPPCESTQFPGTLRAEVISMIIRAFVVTALLVTMTWTVDLKPSLQSQGGSGSDHLAHMNSQNEGSGTGHGSGGRAFAHRGTGHEGGGCHRAAHKIPQNEGSGTGHGSGSRAFANRGTGHSGGGCNRAAHKIPQNQGSGTGHGSGGRTFAYRGTGHEGGGCNRA
jgi:hypothetical protein